MPTLCRCFLSLTSEKRVFFFKKTLFSFFLKDGAEVSLLAPSFF